MTEIKIISDIEIDFFELHNLNEDVLIVRNKQTIDLEKDWHLLVVPYRGQKIEIEDIQINGQSLQHVIYTGFFEDASGERFQPATAVWTDGNFKIWIHPSIGFLKATIFEQIKNGDYGKNLFENYMLTVDRPINIPEYFPEELRDFFKNGSGPHWWHKDNLPYKVLDDTLSEDMLNDKHKVVDQCHNIDINPRAKNWTTRRWKRTDVGGTDYFANPTKIDEQSFDGFGKYFTIMGWNHIIGMHDSDLGPRSWIHLHIDPCPHRENVNVKKLYFTYEYENKEHILFKLNKAGLIPIDKAVLVNTWDHSHCVVNLGNNTRKNFIAYGTNL